MKAGFIGLSSVQRVAPGPVGDALAQHFQPGACIRRLAANRSLASLFLERPR